MTAARLGRSRASVCTISANVSVKLLDATLRGVEISGSFTADVNGSALKHEFAGRVAGGSIEGSMKLSGSRAQGQLDWSATRGNRSGMAYEPVKVTGVNY